MTHVYFFFLAFSLGLLQSLSRVWCLAIHQKRPAKTTSTITETAAEEISSTPLVPEVESTPGSPEETEDATTEIFFDSVADASPAVNRDEIQFHSEEAEGTEAIQTVIVTLNASTADAAHREDTVPEHTKSLKEIIENPVSVAPTTKEQWKKKPDLAEGDSNPPIEEDTTRTDVTAIKASRESTLFAYRGTSHGSTSEAMPTLWNLSPTEATEIASHVRGNVQNVLPNYSYEIASGSNPIQKKSKPGFEKATELTPRAHREQLESAKALSKSCTKSDISCEDCTKISPYCHYSHTERQCRYADVKHGNLIYECGTRFYPVDAYNPFYMAIGAILLVSVGVLCFLCLTCYRRYLKKEAIPKEQTEDMRDHLQLVREKRLK